MVKAGRVFNLLVFNLCPALRDWHRPQRNYKSPLKAYNLARWLGTFHISKEKDIITTYH